MYKSTVNGMKKR